MDNFIPVEQLWSFCTTNIKLLTSQHLLLGETTKDGLNISIYVTEENDFPFFTVEVNGEESYVARTSSRTEAEDAYKVLLNLFVEEEEPEEELDSEEERRADEILCAVEDMLCVMLEVHHSEAGLQEDDLDAVAYAVEDFLYQEYGFSIWHPRKIDGEIVSFPFDDDPCEEGK